jgi:hypothetical protein
MVKLPKKYLCVVSPSNYCLEIGMHRPSIITAYSTRGRPFGGMSLFGLIPFAPLMPQYPQRPTIALRNLRSVSRRGVRCEVLYESVPGHYYSMPLIQILIGRRQLLRVGIAHINRVGSPAKRHNLSVPG